MKKLLLLIGLGALYASGAFAQCGAYADFSLVAPDSTNLYGAMNNKLNIQCGTTAPTALGGTAGIDAYVNTTNGNFYICTVTGTPCGSGGSGWILQTPAFPISIAHGGTGQATAAAAITALMPSAVQGDVVYFDGTNWDALAPGTSGQVLSTNGASANPSWINTSGGTGCTIAGTPTTNYFVYYNGTNCNTSTTANVDVNGIFNVDYTGTSVNHSALAIYNYTTGLMGTGPGTLSNILVENPNIVCCNDTTTGTGFSNFAWNYGTITLQGAGNGQYINHIHYVTANINDNFAFTANAGAEIVWGFYHQYEKNGSAVNTEHVGYENIVGCCGSGNLTLDIGFRDTTPIPTSTGIIPFHAGFIAAMPTITSALLTTAAGIDIAGTASGYKPANNAWYGLATNQFSQFDASQAGLVVLGATSTPPLMIQQTFVRSFHGRIEDGTGLNYNGEIMQVDGCCGGTAGNINAYSAITDTPGTTATSVNPFLATMKNGGGAALTSAIGYEATIASVGSGSITNTYGFYAHGIKSGTQTSIFGFINDTAGTSDSFQNTTVVTLNTATNCSSAASPAVCGSAAAGVVSIAAAASTVQVNTTAVTANSEIHVNFDASLGTKLSLTCNTTLAPPYVTARTAGANFTISVAAAPTVNPACYSYQIVN